MTGLNARLAGFDEDVPFVADVRTLRGTEILTLDTDEGRIDLLFRPSGSAVYEELRNRSEQLTILGEQVNVVSLDDLIAMKREAGRPQDLADVVQLEAIRRLRASG